MKRDFLKSLQLTDEQIDSIMAENGKDIEANKATIATLQTENEGFKTQINARDKDIKDLKKQAGNNTDLAQKYSELQDKYKNETAELSQQLNQTKLDSALESALSQENPRNNKAVRGMLNMNDIKLNDQGEIVGLKDQIESLKETDAYLFDEGTETDYKPAGGTNPEEKKDTDFKSIAEMAAEARIIEK